MPGAKKECEIAIIGAGAAGLAAASVLAQRGKSVQCLEATDRIGGRIRTIHDPASPLPIELGAEFVHGRPPEIWNMIRSHAWPVYEHTPSALRIDSGRVKGEEESGEAAGRLLSGPAASTKGADQSLSDLLRHSRQPAEAKKRAALFLEGFNAAREERISVAALKKDAEAAEEIEGDLVFRLLNGYDSVPLALLKSLPKPWETVRLNQIVEAVRWQPGNAHLKIRSAVDGSRTTLRCRQLVVAVPLGVLKEEPGSEGAIHFDPVPPNRKAAAKLEFGHVYRVTLRFDDVFWNGDPQLQHAGFLISQENRFPTWWTSYPVIAPLLTGWAAGTAADSIGGLSRGDIVAEAIGSLSRILNRKLPRVAEAYFHNWRTDPFYRGAYSYVPVNGLAARKALGRPVEDTLFFAGEATNADGHGGTVHGAIASGQRAAARILKLTAQK